MKNFAPYALVILILIITASVYAGKAELTTTYPAPYGEYRTLKTTGDATLNGLAVGRGGGSIDTNTAVGHEALLNNAVAGFYEGDYNSAFGYQALYSNVGGPANSAFGASALRSNTIRFNSAFGAEALYSNTATSSVPYSASNSAFGRQALYSNTTGYYNVAFGETALYSNISGERNLAFGCQALYSNTTGYLNLAVGQQALYENVGGFNNAAVGAQALQANTTGTLNMALGVGALLVNASGNDNTALGKEALANTTTAAGQYASRNTAVGHRALYNNTTGYWNTAIGKDAGSNNATLGTTTGNTTGYNNTFIGYGAIATDSAAHDQIILGNSAIQKLRCAVTVLSPISDARDKKDIAPLSYGLDFISSLKPVAFTWNTRDGAKAGIKSSGFIAQDLQEAQAAAPGAAETLGLVYAGNPDKLEAAPGNLLPVIAKAIQELQDKVIFLRAQVEAKKARDERLGGNASPK